MFGSWQPLLNCHGGFHLSTNAARLRGEEMATEQQQKKSHTTVFIGAKSHSPSAGKKGKVSQASL